MLVFTILTILYHDYFAIVNYEDAVANDDDDNIGQVATGRGVDKSDKGALCPFHSQLAREQHTRHLTFNSLHIFHKIYFTFNAFAHFTPKII